MWSKYEINGIKARNMIERKHKTGIKHFLGLGQGDNVHIQFA